MDYQEKIDSFIRGEMTPLQEELFIRECKQNKELREQAIATAYLVKALGKIHGKSIQNSKE